MSIKKILLYAWQLPQNLLGLAVRAWYRRGEPGTDWSRAAYPVPHTRYSCADITWSKSMRGGIALGEYIVINYYSDQTLVKHETGHFRQSRMLGWLYLIIIGLPSLLWAATHKVIAPKKSYYWFYTERWADRLAGIER